MNQNLQQLVGICSICQVIYRLGHLPMSHGYCAKCFELELKKIEEYEDSKEKK